MKNKLKLKFKENFSGYLSIKKKFEISDFSELNIITGINGSGKTHFLKAIERGDIEAEYNSEKILPQHIKFFDYNSFKLENEKVVDLNNFKTEKNSFLEKAHNLLLSMDPSKINLLFGISGFNNIDIWNILEEKLKTKHKFFSFQKLIEMKKNDKLNEFFLKNPDIANDDVIKFVKEMIDSEKYLTINKDNLYKEYNINLEKNIFEMNESDIDKIVRTKLGDFLEKGFGEIFKQYKDILHEYLDSSENLEKTKGELTQECEKKYGIFPWNFANEMFEKYSEDVFKFKYKFEQPKYINEKGVEAKLMHTSNRSVAFENLSSGEKMLLALTLFLYQLKIRNDFPKLLLLDEIDVTLHPSMCKKVIKALKEIFVENGIKIILATHNPSLVAACDSVDDGIFVKTHDGIESKKISDAINILSDGLVTLDKLLILSDVAKDKIIVFSEGNNYDYFNEAAKLYDKEEKIYFAEIRRDFGDGNLRTLFKVFKEINNSRKIFYIWDCDYGNAEGRKHRLSQEENEHNTPIILDSNTRNGKIIKGIENMIPEDFCNELNIDNNNRVKNKKLFFEGIKNKADAFTGFKNVFIQILDETSKDTQEQKNKNKNNNPFDIIKV